MTVALTFEGVGRAFHGPRQTVDALSDVWLDLPPGSRTALVGRSGSGKSTLLHIAAGLDPGHTGRLRRAPVRPRVGLAFQDHRLLPWRSALGNVEFALSATGRSTEAATAALETVGLGEVAAAYPATLSGGMRQRIGLARALAVQPDLLLLDEPLSAVDELDADRIGGRIRALAADWGATILLATHRIREACLLADRVVVMEAGRVSAVVDLDRGEPGDPDAEAEAERRVRAACRNAVGVADPFLADGRPQ